MKGFFSSIFNAFGSSSPEQPTVSCKVVTTDGVGIPDVAITIKDRPSFLTRTDGSFDVALTDERFVIEKVERQGYALVSPKLPYTSEKGNTKLQIVMKRAKPAAGAEDDSIRQCYEAGQELHKQGKYKDAQSEYNRAIEMAKAHYGESNKYIAICYELYGDNYFAWRAWGPDSTLNYADAKTYYNYALQYWISTLGNNSTVASRLHNKIGACWWKLENDAEAAKKYEQAKASLKASGEENPHLLASIYDNMGKMAFENSDWGTALKHFNSELDELYIKHRDEDGLDNKMIADCMASIGRTKAKLNMSPVSDYQEAFKFYRAAGPLCEEVAVTCLDLVKYYYATGNLEKTMETMKKLLLVSERVYGKDSDYYQSIIGLIGKLEKEMKDKQ